MNLLTATKSLIHSIWNPPLDESDSTYIRECVKLIRANADESDPVCSPDPIAFIYVFAIVLIALVPLDAVRRCEDEIYEVMGEMAGIAVEEDASSWTGSRKECLKSAYYSALMDPNLEPKLKRLVCTLDLQ